MTDTPQTLDEAAEKVLQDKLRRKAEWRKRSLAKELQEKRKPTKPTYPILREAKKDHERFNRSRPDIKHD